MNNKIFALILTGILLVSCGKTDNSTQNTTAITGLAGTGDQAASAQTTESSTASGSAPTNNTDAEELTQGELPFENIFEVAALYHSINPDRPVQYNVLLQQMRIPYSNDPNEQEKNIQKAKADIDSELKNLPKSKLRLMTLDRQTTPVYDKELGGMAVEIPESLYVDNAAYSIEIVNRKRFTFIPLNTPEEVDNADKMGFNQRKNYSMSMSFKLRVLDRKASGLNASGNNKIYAELKEVEFFTTNGIPVRKFEGI